jgi:hypothetical protein
MITITKQQITPMLRMILEWDAVPGAVDYVVKIQEAGTLDLVQEATTLVKYRVDERLKNAAWYHLRIVARDAGELVIDTTPVINLWTNVQGGTAPLLRQAIYDAIENAGMTMVDDGYYMPRSWGKTTAPSITLPAIEIGMPSLASTQPYAGETKLHTWQVPIMVRVGDDKGDPDNQAGAWLLFEMVQGAIDGDGILLNNVGVMDEEWSWSANLATGRGRSKTTVVEAVLSIPVHKVTGMILMPQPAVVPEEPVAPPDL